MAAEWHQPGFYKVSSGSSFCLADQNPNFTGNLKDKSASNELLLEGVQQLAKFQDLLYADARWGVLIVLQAIDAAGKDSTIKHVMSGVNPQGVRVHSFKHPSVDDLRHNWLWRYNLGLPQRGEIGIFNRSYYEEVLVVKVHNLVANQSLPDSLLGPDIWENRYEDINAFEKHLFRNGIIVLKFFLHISADEQRKRFLKRLHAPEKNWKFSFSDLEERRYWDDYQNAFEAMLQNTSTSYAPWYCVPMNNKWFGRLIITKTINAALDDLKLRYPLLTKDQNDALAKGKKLLS
ncbi:polyphosphate kinase 2 family protein [Synechococcus sp. UW140]|uniref:polyphosphate kinase 2 family protein n=1 Tax=Synechococcus sp. UW140 TaxID=368503 RepID=UPI0025F540F8|nr:polyphosphate kinase 2 family protein [Synechococcus sp. UW140]